MKKNEILCNSSNKSIFQPSIIAKNMVKLNNFILKNKSVNLNKISPLEIKKNNKNINKLSSPIVKIKKKILFSKKDKQKENLKESPINYISSESTNNSNNYSNINKLKDLIKFNNENYINNSNIIINTNINNGYISPLIENQNFFSLSFNAELSKYLIKNNNELYNKKSLLIFKEKNNIRRKICYLNDFCKNILIGYKKNDYFENLLNNIDKSEIIYNKYKLDIDNYLSFIKKQRIKEETVLDKIIAKKLHLKNIINKLYNYIAKEKFIINECKEIKNFLLKVKYGVPDIDDIPKNILALYENESKYIEKNIVTKVTSNKDIRTRKNTINQVTYPNIIVKKLLKLPNNNKQFIELDIKNYLNNGNNENFYLTPIKYMKKINNNNLYTKINESKRLDKRLSFKKKNLISNMNKKFILNKNPIFDDPEEFMNRYNELVFKSKKSLEYYNEILFQIQNLKNVEQKGNDYLFDEEIEKKSKIILNRLYQENYILNKKIELYTKLNNSPGLEENITNKIKKILLEINSFINIEKKFNIIQFEYRLEKYETDSLQTKEEKNKSKTTFLMEILEKILENLMSVDKFYKNDPIYYEKYKKIKAVEESIKLKKIRKRQIEKLKRKESEKNKKIIQNLKKFRFLYLNKKGMEIYHKCNTSKKEIDKTPNISSFNETFSFNNFFSLSFERKTNYKQIKNNNIPNTKKESKSKIKREEMINFLSY